MRHDRAPVIGTGTCKTLSQQIPLVVQCETMAIRRAFVVAAGKQPKVLGQRSSKHLKRLQGVPVGVWIASK